MIQVDYQAADSVLKKKATHATQLEQDATVFPIAEIELEKMMKNVIMEIS